MVVENKSKRAGVQQIINGECWKIPKRKVEEEEEREKIHQKGFSNAHKIRVTQLLFRVSKKCLNDNVHHYIRFLKLTKFN